MTQVEWHKQSMLGFDTETTGINVEQDRIVTVSLVHIAPGGITEVTEHLANPGIDIPEQATAIHGITTQHAHEHGQPPAQILADTVATLTEAIRDNLPIITMNGVYDLTLLDRECLRHNVKTLTDTVGHVAPIIDILLLDKAMDRYRKGPRNLTALAHHYGITLDNAHNATADALTTCRIAWCLCEKYPALQINPTTLHHHQTVWAAGQRASFAAYRARTGQPITDTDPTWPIRPRKHPTPTPTTNHA